MNPLTDGSQSFESLLYVTNEPKLGGGVMPHSVLPVYYARYPIREKTRETGHPAYPYSDRVSNRFLDPTNGEPGPWMSYYTN
jgi:hypothetical protein